MHFSLPWQALDPAARGPLEMGPVREVVLAVLHGSPWPWSQPTGILLSRQVHQHILAQLGPWASGWQWSETGPVRSWCCPGHSLKGSPDACADRIVAALGEWDAWLRLLALTFERLRRTSAGLDELDRTAKAAQELLPIVLDCTNADDAWYATYDRVLTWFVQSVSPHTVGIEPLIASVTHARFRSWIEPDAKTAREVVEDVALEIAGRATAPYVPDALRAWQRLRATTPWTGRRTGPPLSVRYDGHRRYIETRDASRSRARAEQMSMALAAVRSAARHGLELDLGRLQSWQRLVLEVDDVPVREHDARAKGGAERYGTPDDLGELVDGCLADAVEANVPLGARAVRLYLDLCFLHPFSDGNARSARLAFDFLLSREDCALHSAEVLFGLPRWAHDPQGPTAMMRALDYLVGER